MFELKNPPRMKWYHWLLYPWAKRFSCLDENTYLKGFRIFGKVYITKMTSVAN